MTPQEAQKIRDLACRHWNWLEPIIQAVPPENRTDSWIGYLVRTTFVHGGKHFEELDK